MSKLAEGILLGLSRSPLELRDYPDVSVDWTLENALDGLSSVFSHFLTEIRDRTILDFGCGNGWQSVAMARQGARQVVGVDLNPAALQRARALARQHELEGATEFHASLEPRMHGQFDIVISQNSMEHFADPGDVLEQMRLATRPGGKVMITFAAPWYSPWGSHMQFFTKTPWVNLLFSEETVMKVRARFRTDGACRYTEVESGLNKMSVAKFERLIDRCPLAVDFRLYECVKGVDFLARVPVVRELFINRVSCILRQPM